MAEMMVAAVIMILAFVGILATFIRCLELNELSRNTGIATTAAKARMELIKDTAFTDLATTYDKVPFFKTGFTGAGVSYVDTTDPNLYKITVSFCFREKNGRVIGEDTNLNGVLNAGEDTNGNGMIDSPVELATYIYHE